MDGKKLWESKTFWLAVIQGVAGILVVVVAQYPGIGSLLIAKSVVDVFLRIITETPIV